MQNLSINIGSQDERENPCGWADVNGASCSLESGHTELHEFTILPSEEYFEEDECSTESENNMVDLEVKGGLNTSKVIGSPTEKKGSGSKSVTLSFVTEAEVAAFDYYSNLAEEDERTLSKYLVRWIRQAAEDNIVTE